MPAVVAAVSSAAIFALMHGLFITNAGASGWVYTGDVFALGLLAAYWAIATGSLRPGFAAHFGYNGVLVAMYFAAAH